MDFFGLNILIGLLSGVLIMAGIVYLLYYVLGSFSSRSGAQSPKVFLFSVLYFFGSTIPLLLIIEWFTGLARTRAATGQPFFLNLGAGALGLSVIIHYFCGFVTVLLYVRGQGSVGLIFQRLREKLRNLRLSRSKR